MKKTRVSCEYPKWVNGQRVLSRQEEMALAQSGPVGLCIFTESKEPSVDFNDPALALTIDQFAERYLQPALAKVEQQCNEFDKMLLDEYPSVAVEDAAPLIDVAPVATPPPSPYDEPIRRKRGRPRKSK